MEVRAKLADVPLSDSANKDDKFDELESIETKGVQNAQKSAPYDARKERLEMLEKKVLLNIGSTHSCGHVKYYLEAYKKY